MEGHTCAYVCVYYTYVLEKMPNVQECGQGRVLQVCSTHYQHQGHLSDVRINTLCTHWNAVLHELVGREDGDKVVHQVRLLLKQLWRHIFHGLLQCNRKRGWHPIPRLGLSPTHTHTDICTYIRIYTHTHGQRYASCTTMDGHVDWQVWSHSQVPTLC